jgi:hypothetical protein
MIRLPVAIATFIALATSLAAGPAAADDDLHSLYDKALQLAQRAADQARSVSDAAAREADEAIAHLDFDNLAAEAFLSHELGSRREIVKNAPYTASAITETTQTLMDGNRIVHRSLTLLARDSLGRTRQEKKTERGGTAYIYDPIENRSYVLRTDGKTAVALPRAPGPPTPPTPPTPPAPPAAPTPAAKPDAAGIAIQPGRVIVRKSQVEGGGEDIHVEVIRVGREEDSGSADTRVGRLPPMPPLRLQGRPLALPDRHADRGVTESLGSRDFDGVRADGKRTTHTIPAGAIGNEKPIAIVSERWFSPELNVVVMSRTSDPRSGETVYRLTDIKRGEPPPELFRVPADYKIRGSRSR